MAAAQQGPDPINSTEMNGEQISPSRSRDKTQREKCRLAQRLRRQRMSDQQRQNVLERRRQQRARETEEQKERHRVRERLRRQRIRENEQLRERNRLMSKQRELMRQLTSEQRERRRIAQKLRRQRLRDEQGAQVNEARRERYLQLSSIERRQSRSIVDPSSLENHTNAHGEGDALPIVAFNQSGEISLPAEGAIGTLPNHRRLRLTELRRQARCTIDQSIDELQNRDVKP